MAIEVFDFYTKEALNVDRPRNLLLSNALFYILLKINGKEKELSIQVPKKFHYERFYKYADFTRFKAVEYSILSDFIRCNKDLVKSKWGLGERDYLRLVTKLEAAFIKNYYVRGLLWEWVMLFGVWIEELIDTLVWRFNK